MGKQSLKEAQKPQGVKDGLRVLTSYSEMVEHAALWRDLDARTSAKFVWFQSYEWCANWMLQHGGGDCIPRVLMLIKVGKAVAVLPLMQQSRSIGLQLLKIMGDPHTQYANVLTENGTLDQPSILALKKAILEQQGVDQVLFHLVPEGSALAAFLQDAMDLPYLANSANQLCLKQFGSAEAFEEGIGKKTSRNLRRAINHFEKLGHLHLDVVRPDDGSYAALIDKCLKMKATWLLQTGRHSNGLAFDNHGQFLASIQNTCGTEDGPIIFALKTDEDAIAIEIGFLQQGHYYAYMGAFDWNLRNYSPGKLQMHMSIKWLIANGAKTLDLLGNPADYKQNYSSIETPLLGFAIAPTWRGKIYTKLWTGLGRPKAKQMFHKIPPHWRASFMVLRKLEYNFIA